MTIKLSHNALVELANMITYGKAVEQLSNQELATILVEQVWAEMDIGSPGAALINEIANRLAPELLEEAGDEQEDHAQRGRPGTMEGSGETD